MPATFTAPATGPSRIAHIRSSHVLGNVETRSLSPEDATQKLRNFSLRDLDSISEGRRIGPPGPAAPPTVLEVKSSVGVRS